MPGSVSAAVVLFPKARQARKTARPEGGCKMEFCVHARRQNIILRYSRGRSIGFSFIGLGNVQNARSTSPRPIKKKLPRLIPRRPCEHPSQNAQRRPQTHGTPADARNARNGITLLTPAGNHEGTQQGAILLYCRGQSFLLAAVSNVHKLTIANNSTNILTMAKK